VNRRIFVEMPRSSDQKLYAPGGFPGKDASTLSVNVTHLQEHCVVEIASAFAGQLEQELAPDAGATEPGGHSMQVLLADSPVENVPGAQMLQTSELVRA
jgi:hypothetical protein